MDTLGTLIEVYKSENYSIPNSSGDQILAYFMEEHGLDVSGLPEIGTSEKIEQF